MEQIARQNTNRPQRGPAAKNPSRTANVVMKKVTKTHGKSPPAVVDQIMAFRRFRSAFGALTDVKNYFDAP